MSLTAQHQLIDGLIAFLEAGGESVELRETHISWVLLSGEYAIKIKKAVDFGFLDFSSLAKRKFACEEELRLNRRYAPQLYLDLVSIGGSPRDPVLDSDTPAVEYAVRMRRFDESGLLSHLAAQGLLRKEQIVTAANRIADLHRQAPVAPADNPWGGAAQVHRWVQESIQHIHELLEDSPRQSQVEEITARCHELYRETQSVLAARNQAGFVRECHGDLHLGNMVWIDNRLVPFDCIEFNPGLRWIDIISEAAFVMMDLEDRGYPVFAWVFINQYLANTGDYAGLEVLRYYLVYRALVRAKVTLLQRSDPDTLPEERPKLLNIYLDYAALAQRWLQQRRAVLILTHGLSASGKSTAARHIAEKHGCIHLRSDVERKRLHGLAALQDSHAQVGTGIYTAEGSERTYQHLLKLAETALRQGYPVIVDAAFLERGRRNLFSQLAQTQGCLFLIVHCEADRATLEQRIVDRAAQGQDPSEATLAVLDRQIEQQDPLLVTEPSFRIRNTRRFELPAPVRQQLGELEH